MSDSESEQSDVVYEGAVQPYLFEPMATELELLVIGKRKYERNSGYRGYRFVVSSVLQFVMHITPSPSHLSAYIDWSHPAGKKTCKRHYVS